MNKKDIQDFCDKVVICDKVVNRQEDFVVNDDGFYVYWPSREVNGYLDEYSLLSIFAHLNKLNREWDKQVDDYFANQL